MDIYDDFRPFYEKIPIGIYRGPGEHGGRYASHAAVRWHAAAAPVRLQQSPSPPHAACLCRQGGEVRDLPRHPPGRLRPARRLLVLAGPVLQLAGAARGMVVPFGPASGLLCSTPWPPPALSYRTQRSCSARPHRRRCMTTVKVACSPATAAQQAAWGGEGYVNVVPVILPSPLSPCPPGTEAWSCSITEARGRAGTAGEEQNGHACRACYQRNIVSQMGEGGPAAGGGEAHRRPPHAAVRSRPAALRLPPHPGPAAAVHSVEADVQPSAGQAGDSLISLRPGRHANKLQGPDAVMVLRGQGAAGARHGIVIPCRGRGHRNLCSRSSGRKADGGSVYIAA